ncbi:ornithine cyclodeaminase family protein [Myxococcus sp. AS-1-15]|uniref:ornithine cyclodeaminase family protein n=1 Tax=Myxococcus sp. AS-1-15 TaxID=2874600 RepID=UPI001CBEA77B|nr:ornithine cyclodeaminase family protein [Myxococcus sp. AS-1-15]MBZ4411197.1 ornithine cyclodeaminase family protein [Myxococcus sp. XM-1-1-1]BDT34809.1 ornithine cyclodeaminase family protein [Myxococcus sp. MH1]
MKSDATRTLLVTRADLRCIVEAVGADALMDELIRALTDALRTFDGELTEVRKRDGFLTEHPRQPGCLEWMPVMQKGGAVTVKMVSYSPFNPEEQGLPTIIATNSLYDSRTGHLVALMDGVFATALRTGAASAVATRCLASPDSRVLGLVGCGAQAVTQLHAISRVFPLTEVLAYDTNPEAQASLARRTAFLGLDVKQVSLSELEERSDIICTATSIAVGAGPVISGKALKPHVHVNAVGSDLPGKTELPRALLEKSLVCPDFTVQALVEGECQQLKPEQVGPDLVTLVKNPDRYESWRQKATVFDSTGYALEDQVVTALFLRHAERLGLGTSVGLETVGGDALDPYSLLHEPGAAARGNLRRATGS